MNMCERDRIPSNFFTSSTAVLGATTVDLSAIAISSPCMGVTRPLHLTSTAHKKKPDVLSQLSAKETHLSSILGRMGTPMALHLLEKGYSVCVFNRNKASVNELVARGAKAAESPSRVAQESDVVIDMVTDAPDVEQVLLQEDGVIESARKGLIVVDMSTNSPETAILVSSQLAEKGVEFLDAPVSGGDKGAREATLTIMVGGKKEVFDACRPIFQVMGKEIVYMGSAGSGQATKLCNQVAVALHTLATCEALLLGSSYGLPTKDLLRVLTNGAASSWILINLGPRVVAR